MQPRELIALHSFLLLGEDFRVEGLFELEQMPEDARLLCAIAVMACLAPRTR